MKNNKKTKKQVYDTQNGCLSGDCVQKASNRAKRVNYVHIDNASFHALLIRSFASFSLIIILGVIAIFCVVSWATRYEGITIRKKEISDYASELASGVVSGDFSKIPIKQAFGEEGYLEVVRADGEHQGEVVFSSRNSSEKYTLGELDCIQLYGNVLPTVTVYNFKDAGNKPNYYLIIFTSYSEDGSKTEKNYLLRYEGENNYAIESQSGVSTSKTKFTNKEFEYLVYNAKSEEHVLTRYAFKGADGNDYYAVTLCQTQRTSMAVYFVAIVIVVLVVALFLLVIVLYIRYINKHVQKPLAVLSTAMTNFANGEHEHVEYKGSKEFEHLYDTFNEMVDLLHASEEQKRVLQEDKQRMLTGLSHDLKTPITIIQGFTKAIKDGLVSEDDKPKYLQVILSKSTQMTALINQLYDYNKLEHPDFDLEKERVDVAELARSFLAGIYDEFEVRGYLLEIQIPEEKVWCDVDKRQIVRVLENIVANFFKYTPVGSTLLFNIEKAGDKVCISIADNGPGVSEDARRDLFEAFVVGEKSRNKQGSGLGLAVCKKIIDMHGGSISLAKEPMDGYSVQFDIVLDVMV